MVLAQAKARGVTPRLIVVPHPIGGLNAAELGGRVELASAAMMKLLQTEQD